MSWLRANVANLALLAALFLLAAQGLVFWLFKAQMHQAGYQACRADLAAAAPPAVASQAQAVVRQAKVDLARSTQTGLQREQQRTAIDRVFDQLAAEASHHAPHPVDSCVLPADRLRRWAAANAGVAANAAHPGAAAAQPAESAPAAASPAVGPHGRPGSQPPAGGPAVPPAGQPAVPLAAVPAGTTMP